MANLGLSGLASGIDTASIVEQLMTLERQSTQKIGWKQTRATEHQTVLKDIQTKVAKLKDAAAALKATNGAWNESQAVESSDSARVAVAKISGAGIGGRSISVERLASSAQKGFSVGDLAAGGSLTIASGAADPVTGVRANSMSFTFAEDATASAMAEQINARGGSPVYAAVVKNAAGEERLVLSARTTGESSRVDVTSDVLSADAAYASKPDSLNARYRLDGDTAARETETNVVENAIAGLRLTFKGLTSAPATITVGAPDIDRSGVKTKIRAFVDAYNGLVTSARTEINEKSVSNPQSTADLKLGQLFGDTGLNGLLSTMRNELRTKVAGVDGIDELADLGIDVPKASGGAVSADAKAGKFSVDDAKLTQALEADWTKVSAFFEGFATKVEALVNTQTRSDGSGVLDQRIKNDDRSLKVLADTLAKMNTRLDAREKRLTAQFAAMELALSSANTQQSWLSGQLTALNGSNKS
jgi:flagellar hook-associated protein 2